MAHIRDYTKSFINIVVGLFPFDRLQLKSNHKLILPFYHAVSDEPLPHIDQLYSVKSIKQFRADLDFLLSQYQPISATDLLAHVRNGTNITKPSFLLSFDDGLSQVHDVIAPILREKGVPAICFLNSGFIDNYNLFYRYKVSLIIHDLCNDPRKIDLIPDHDTIERFSKYLLSLGYHETDQIDEIARILEVDFGQFLANYQPYMTTEQISALVDQGWCFGGHSVDHPQYQALELDQQLSQTVESVQYVKQHFGLDYGLFSFPFSDYRVKQSFFNKIQKLKLIDLSFGCAGIKDQEYSSHFQRIAMEDGLMSAEAILKNEYLYYGMKSIIGKNKIERDA